MLLFRFEDVVLQVLGQQPGNTISTSEQLALAVYGGVDPTETLALSGDILNFTNRHPVELWEELFGVPSKETFFQGHLRLTKDREQAAVFREVERIIGKRYPWTKNHHTLLRESVASSLSFAFLEWIQRENSEIAFQERSDMPTLYQHLFAQIRPD